MGKGWRKRSVCLLSGIAPSLAATVPVLSRSSGAASAKISLPRRPLIVTIRGSQKGLHGVNVNVSDE